MDFFPFLSASTCCIEILFISQTSLFPGVLPTFFMFDCPQLHSKFLYLILFINLINVFFSSFLRSLIKIRPKQAAFFPHLSFALFIITLCSLSSNVTVFPFKYSRVIKVYFYPKNIPNFLTFAFRTMLYIE